MKVKELIDITKEYNPEAKVRVAMGAWIKTVDKIKTCVNMNIDMANKDTSMFTMCICVEE